MDLIVILYSLMLLFPQAQKSLLIFLLRHQKDDDDLENLGLTFFEYHDGILYFDARPELTFDDRKLWAGQELNPQRIGIKHGRFARSRKLREL